MCRDVNVPMCLVPQFSSREEIEKWLLFFSSAKIPPQKERGEKPGHSLKRSRGRGRHSRGGGGGLLMMWRLQLMDREVHVSRTWMMKKGKGLFI